MRLLLVAVLLLLASPASLFGQEDELAVECAGASALCLRVAQAIEIAQPRLGVALTAGNPVPGTASTLGRRIGSLPRISVGGRITAVRIELPPIRRANGGEADFLLTSINGDVAVGLFPGFSLAPTVGGVASVDLLASVGLLPMLGDGFDSGLPLSAGVGVRLGLLRESFTLPGLSVSAMYRLLDEVTFGDPDFGESEAYFTTDLSAVSVRAAISKRLFGFGATAGVGYDRYASDVTFGARGARFEFNSFTNDRVSAFANLSWTLLILHVVAEIGWQEGGEVVPGVSVERLGVDPEDGALFGSIAVRVSI